MVKGGGYLSARTRQPPTTQTIKKKLVWVRGVVCRSTQTQSLTVVACVILQCIYLVQGVTRGLQGWPTARDSG
jgi:hypothetical protein